MTNSLKKISECKREIELEIPADEVTKELDKIISQFSSNAKIRGFRPGKAPREIVKRKYDADIREALINSLVPEVFNRKLEEMKINPVGKQIISELNFKESEPLRFKVQFEVWPEIQLTQYKNIKVKKREVTVNEKEINEFLEELRLKSTQYIPVKSRGVMDGDYVIAEIKGKDIRTKKFLPTEKVVILAGHPDNEDILNQRLKGIKTGETRKFTISYKKEHQNKKLAGREIEYDLKIESIKEKKIPEINDDFAKDLGEYKDLKDLKSKIEMQISDSKKNTQKSEIAEEIINNIQDTLSLEVPESIVDQEYLSMFDRHFSSYPRQNISEKDFESLKVEFRKRAEKNIKRHLILSKIAEIEHLDVSEEELKEEMKAIAKSNNVSLAKVIDSINKEGKREELRNNLLIRKTIDFLVESAIIE